MTVKQPISGTLAVFPSVELSESGFLGAIWVVSVSLAGLSVLALLLLGVLRALRDARAARDRRRVERLREEIRGVLLVDAPLEDLGLRPFAPSERRALIALLLEYFSTLQGDLLTRLKLLIRAWDVEALLAAMVRRGGRHDKLRSLAVLSRLDSKSSLKLIREVLNDEDGPVRLAALSALANRRADVPTDLIIETARRVASENVELVSSVFRRMGVDAQAAMEGLVRSDPDVAALGAALGGLAEIGASATTVDLLALSEHPDMSIRKRVAHLAASMSTDAARQAILRLLVDDEAQVREEAARVLGDRKRVDAIEPLAARLGDQVWGVRLAACLSLVQLGPAGRLLIQAAVKEDPSLSAIAEEALIAGAPA